MTDLSMHRSSYHFQQRYEIVRHTIPREEKYQAAEKNELWLLERASTFLRVIHSWNLQHRVSCEDMDGISLSMLEYETPHPTTRRRHLCIGSDLWCERTFPHFRSILARDNHLTSITPSHPNFQYRFSSVYMYTGTHVYKLQNYLRALLSPFRHGGKRLRWVLVTVSYIVTRLISYRSIDFLNSYTQLISTHALSRNFYLKHDIVN